MKTHKIHPDAIKFNDDLTEKHEGAKDCHPRDILDSLIYNAIAVGICSTDSGPSGKAFILFYFLEYLSHYFPDEINWDSILGLAHANYKIKKQ